MLAAVISSASHPLHQPHALNHVLMSVLGVHPIIGTTGGWLLEEGEEASARGFSTACSPPRLNALRLHAQPIHDWRRVNANVNGSCKTNDVCAYLPLFESSITMGV